MKDREKRAIPRLLSVNVGLPRDVAWRGKRREMRPCGRHAGPGFVTLARLDSSAVLSVTGQSPWSRRPTAMR
jgi:hypothetical protein